MSQAPFILVAENPAPGDTDAIAPQLRDRGWRVEAVTDGKSALRFLEQQTPDLALLDVQLRGVSGMEVLRLVRRRFSHDVLPVILVTALGDPQHIVWGLEAGANDYIVKPVVVSVLLARISVAMRIQRTVRLLTEADRQRVLIAALGEVCHQLAQPMQAVLMTLDELLRYPPDRTQDLLTRLAEVRDWLEEVSKVIHRLQAVGAEESIPFLKRMEMLDRGSPESEGERPSARKRDNET